MFVQFRAKLDNNERLQRFAQDLEDACIEAIDTDNVLTKDLALSVYGKKMERKHYVTTQEWLDYVAGKMQLKTQSYTNKL